MKPLSQMPTDLKRRIDRIDRDLENSIRDTIRAAARAAKAEQEDELRGDAGGDLRLSRVRSGRGARVGARYDLTGTGAATTATIKAVGPVPLLANPTPAHAIPKTGTRLRRARRRLLLRDGNIRSSVNHPGTRGKDTWNQGRRKAEPKVQTIIGRRTDQVMIRSFRAGN